MSIDVYYGKKASAGYENTIFCRLVSNLSNVFKNRSDRIIIVGHPEIKNNKKLNPDCLIITKDQILIIDFKFFGGNISLPQNFRDFSDKPWYVRGALLKGGSYTNPFKQLKAYKEEMEKMLNISGENLVSACLLFHGANARVVNSVPDMYSRWLFACSESTSNEMIDSYLRITKGYNDRCIDIDEVMSYIEADHFDGVVQITDEDLKIIKDYNRKIDRSAHALEAAKAELVEAKRIKAETESRLQEIKSLDENLQSKEASLVNAKLEISEKENNLKLREKELQNAQESFKKVQDKIYDKERILKLQKQIQSEKRKVQIETANTIAAQKELEELKQQNAAKKRNIFTIIFIIITSVTLLASILFVLLFFFANNSSNQPENKAKEETVQESLETNINQESEQSDNIASESQKTDSSAKSSAKQTAPSTQTQTESKQEPQEQTSQKVSYKAYVYDGDTISVYINGAKTEVRLIGIDAPEIQSSYRNAECYGNESKSYLIQRIGGKEITLEADPSQNDKDAYGRLLRYVYYGNELINKTMVDKGYAEEYTYDKPYKFQSTFRASENAAKSAGIGLWNAQTCPR